VAKLPDASEIKPSIGMSGRPIATYDTTGYARGAAAMAQGAKDIGTGLTGAGNQVSAVIKQEKEKDDALDTAQANAWLQVNKINHINSLKDDQDHETLAARSQEALTKIGEDAANMIRDPRRRELFKAVVADDLARAQAGVNDLVHRRKTDAWRAGMIGQLDGLHQGALLAATPEEKLKQVEAANALIDAGANSGFIDREAAVKAKKEWVEKYSTEWLRKQPPEERLKLLTPAPSLDQVVDKIIGVEYGSGKVYKNPNSSASGPGQVIDSTWLSLIKKYRQDIAQGRSDADILALRADEKLSKEMVKAYAVENSAYLEARGLPVNPGTIYLAHFLGPGTAAQVLQAAPGTPVSEIVSPAAVRANPTILKGKTAGTVAEWAGGKMGGGSGRPKIMDTVPDDAQRQILASTNAELNAMRVQREHQAVLERQALKAASDAAEGEWVTRILENKADPTINAVAIAKDERMDINARQQIITFLEKAGRMDKTSNTYGPGFYSVFQRIHLPHGHKDRITDVAQLLPIVKEGGDLTLSGFEKARTEMIGRRTPEGEAEAELRKLFFANARKQISGNNDALGIKDPKGEELNLKFMTQAMVEYEAGKKAGKSPYAMLNPDSPDYIGKSIKEFKRNQADVIADLMSDKKTTPTATTAPAQPAFDPRTLNSLDDLKKAHTAGFLTSMEARAIAVQRGWAKERNPAATPVSTLPTVPLSQ
jgi:hypothetical protein